MADFKDAGEGNCCRRFLFLGLKVVPEAMRAAGQEKAEDEAKVFHGSIAIQSIVEVSVAWELVITKDVPALRVLV